MKKSHIIILAATAVLLIAGSLAVWTLADRWAAPPAPIQTADKENEAEERQKLEQQRYEEYWSQFAYMLNPDGSVKEEFLNDYYAIIDAQNPELEERRQPPVITDPIDALKASGYIWQAAVASGEIPADSRRLTLADVQALYARNLPFQEFIEAVSAIQPYPDWGYGSGQTLMIYWLQGTEDGTRLIIYPFENPRITLYFPKGDGIESPRYEVVTLYQLNVRYYEWNH